MSSLPSKDGDLVQLKRGDLLNSKAHALVNTVNCVGIMGKGIALAFKKRYPNMFRDYVRRCDQGLVQLGKPYAYQDEEKLIINFPTKQHWRSVSRLEDIEHGLEHLRSNLSKWGVRSIAVPPLGCGNGQLEWSVVGPTLYRHLSTFGIPVELYVPHDVEPDQAQLALFNPQASPPSGVASAHEARYVDPATIALVEILHRIEQEPFHWPVGRIMFQKLAYFATAAGLPTGLDYQAASYGPYAADLKRVVGRLQNNGLVKEQQNGRAFEVKVGPTFTDARASAIGELDGWEDRISRVVDLISRFNPSRAEVAASVHYAADALRNKLGRTPTAEEVVDAVLKWKVRRQPPIRREDVEQAVVQLAIQRWIEVEPDDSIADAANELVGV
ncbi:Appr-1-p processing domain protein [Micromonospora aurantiaca ATCC 27029]|nr:macro domain-containing protein [Micromonospora aurantiaca]ADL43597.1 Appr-1-p processing domain protein [Micromonospora aurantiaca ATCC 27029]